MFGTGFWGGSQAWGGADIDLLDYTREFLSAWLTVEITDPYLTVEMSEA